MGFKEIAMIVVALILGGILALNVAPSITASGDATKTSVVASEFESVANASKIWLSNNSTVGTFTGIAADTVASTIPNMTLTGTGAASRLTSKVLGTINYAIVSSTTTSADDSFTITISGLTGINGAEASIKSTLTAKYGAGNITDTVANDGILVTKIRG